MDAKQALHEWNSRDSIDAFQPWELVEIIDALIMRVEELENSGSQWVQLEDYNRLKEKLLRYKAERTKSFLLIWLDGDEKRADEIMTTNGWVEMTSERLTEVLCNFAEV